MYLTKRGDGAFIPSTDSDYEEAKKLKSGIEIKATRARNVKFHRKGFALLNLGFANQDRIENFEVYRKVMTIKAGYYDQVPNKHGEPYYIPKSLSFEKMSQADFEKWYDSTLRIITKELDLTDEQVEAEIAGFY